MDLHRLFNFLADEAEEASETTENTLEQFWLNILEWLKVNGVKLVIGMVVLFLLWFIISIISKIIIKSITRKGKKNPQTTRLVVKIIVIIIDILLLLAFISYVGIETAGIGSIISALTVAIGLAVQGALSNLAGGIIIFLMRPFKIGDFIEAQGQMGSVDSIHLFYTFIKTPDNKMAMIPNGILANGVIVNYSAEKIRRVDLLFSISYESDLDKAIAAINEAIESLGVDVLEDPQPFVSLKEMGESSLNIVTRVWVVSSDYWSVYFGLTRAVKDSFNKNGIKIPYRQLDVHIDK